MTKHLHELGEILEKTMRRKYIIHGGWVISQSDGQEHYIPARQVAELYKVKRYEYYLSDSEAGEGRYLLTEDMLARNPNGPQYIHLYPDPLDNYELPGVVASIPGIPDK